jgi:hypothetical protein
VGLVLPYAQPVSRIIWLTIDDVPHDGQTVSLRLGSAFARPRAVCRLILDYARTRPNASISRQTLATTTYCEGHRAGCRTTLV